MLLLLRRHDSHAADEIGEAWVRAKRIDAGKTGGEILYVASEPAGGIKPFQSRIGISQACVENHKRNGRSTTLSKKPLEFAEEAHGFVAPAAAPPPARKRIPRSPMELTPPAVQHVRVHFRQCRLLDPDSSV